MAGTGSDDGDSGKALDSGTSGSGTGLDSGAAGWK